jgi:hypothetical protein
MDTDAGGHTTMMQRTEGGLWVEMSSMGDSEPTTLFCCRKRRRPGRYAGCCIAVVSSLGQTISGTGHFGSNLLKTKEK